MKQKTKKIHVIVAAILMLCIAANLAGTVYADTQSTSSSVSINQ